MGGLGPFNVESLRTRVLAREDRYVFFGKAKRKSEVHAQLMKSIKGQDEETQLARWGKKATGEMVPDHAIGLVVDEGKACCMIMGLLVGVRISLLIIWQVA